MKNPEKKNEHALAGQGKKNVGPKLSLEKNLVCAIILLTYGAEIIINIFVQKLQN